MTTDNIEGVEDLEEALGKLGAKVEQRRKKIGQESAGRIRHEKNLALGASVAIQRSRDIRDRLSHEAAQLDEIQQRAERMIADVTPPSEPSETEASAEATQAAEDAQRQAAAWREEAERQRQAAEEARAEADRLRREREQGDSGITPPPSPPVTVSPEPGDPAPEAEDRTRVYPTPSVPVARPDARRSLRIMGWSLFGLIVAIIVLLFNQNTPAHAVHVHTAGTHALADFLTFTWWIVVMAMGFFAGRVLGFVLVRLWPRIRRIWDN